MLIYKQAFINTKKQQKQKLHYLNNLKITDPRIFDGNPVTTPNTIFLHTAATCRVRTLVQVQKTKTKSVNVLASPEAPPKA